jgi:hypothetical protein
MRPVTYARIAGLLFVPQLAFAVVHRAAGLAYPRFTHGHDVAVDIGLMVLWGAATLAGLIGRTPEGSGRGETIGRTPEGSGRGETIRRPWQGFFALFAGALASIVHGVMFTIAETPAGVHGAGVPFLAAAAVELYCIVHAAPAFFAEPAAGSGAGHRAPHAFGVWSRMRPSS